MIRHILDRSSGHLSPDTWTWLNDRLADDALRDPRNTTAAGIGGGRTRYDRFIYASTETCIESWPDCALGWKIMPGSHRETIHRWRIRPY